MKSNVTPKSYVGQIKEHTKKRYEVYLKYLNDREIKLGIVTQTINRDHHIDMKSFRFIKREKRKTQTLVREVYGICNRVEKVGEVN